MDAIALIPSKHFPIHSEIIVDPPLPMRFEKKYNGFLKVNGWKPIGGLPDPVPPAMVVHDLMEHFVEGDAKVHWEYMAIGAAILVRGQGGYFGGGPSIHDSLAATAFHMLFHHIIEKGLETKKCPTDPLMLQPLDNAATEYSIKRIILTAELVLKKEHNSDYHKIIDASLLRGEGWIRAGYRMAQVRYKNLEPARLATLYRQVQNHVQTAMDTYVEGEELEIVLKPSEYAYTITTHSPRIKNSEIELK